MSTQTIQISAITIDNQRVIKTVDTKNIAIAAAILIASVITIAVSSAIKFESETVTMALLTAGGIFLVLSIYMMLNKSKKIIYKPTRSKVKLCFSLRTYTTSRSREMDIGRFQNSCTHIREKRRRQHPIRHTHFERLQICSSAALYVRELLLQCLCTGCLSLQ